MKQAIAMTMAATMAATTSFASDGMDAKPNGQIAISGYDLAGVGNRVELPDVALSLCGRGITIGGWADIATTGVALSSGWSEANPLFTLLGDGPVAVLSSGVILKVGTKFFLVESSLVPEHTANLFLGTGGAAASSWNLALMGSAPPVYAIVIALSAGYIYQDQMRKYAEKNCD
tara:strand:- start:797 stop:1318 length:522 start_codon:yes stop_codon:yes gene_type:complete